MNTSLLQDIQLLNAIREKLESTPRELLLTSCTSVLAMLALLRQEGRTHKLADGTLDMILEQLQLKQEINNWLTPHVKKAQAEAN